MMSNNTQYTKIDWFIKFQNEKEIYIIIQFWIDQEGNIIINMKHFLHYYTGCDKYTEHVGMLNMTS
jgi:hypothetical protein